MSKENAEPQTIGGYKKYILKRLYHEPWFEDYLHEKQNCVAGRSVNYLVALSELHDEGSIRVTFLDPLKSDNRKLVTNKLPFKVERHKSLSELLRQDWNPQDDENKR